MEEQQDSGKGHGVWNNEQRGHWLTPLLTPINRWVELVPPLGTAAAELKSRGRPPSVGFSSVCNGGNPVCVEDVAHGFISWSGMLHILKLVE